MGTANPTRAPLIPRLRASERATRIGLPAVGDNLFARIISNPAPVGLPPRERACTEMVCAVLRNAPTLRARLIRELALVARTLLPEELDRLDYELQTERSVPVGKRDDLRLEAWSDSDRSHRVLLWSFEVKVAAGFHESAATIGEEQSSDVVGPAAPRELEHQLLHYDRWLCREIAESVQGFVLARSSKEQAYPPGLQLPWPCITWNWLGLAIEAAVSRDLAAEERLLGRHLAGFIRSYLWNEEEAEMGEPTRIDIDDIALMRAFGAFGAVTKQKIDELVEPLAELLKDPGLGLGPVEMSRALFKATARTIGYGSLFGRTNQPPYLCAGVVTERGTDLAVWIETSPRFRLKEAIHRALSGVLGKLNENADQRRAHWRLLDPADGSAWDIEIRLPLERLLGDDDQKAAGTRFFAHALKELSECGVMTTIGAVIAPAGTSDTPNG